MTPWPMMGGAMRWTGPSSPRRTPPLVAGGGVHLVRRRAGTQQ
ncbi:hypothetical protein AB0H77_16915 [Streptomyces sp. NPDC050844]